MDDVTRGCGFGSGWGAWGGKVGGDRGVLSNGLISVSHGDAIMLRVQTVSVPENVEILVPWRIITDMSEKSAEVLTAELSSELVPKHVLYGLTARAVAARIDRDDVLFEIEGTDMALAVVHLTWRKESDPRWPTTRFFASWEQWVRDGMLPDHQEYSS